MRAESLITSDSVETIIVTWDSVRFAIKQKCCCAPKRQVIILNPREATDLATFISTILKEKNGANFK